MARIASVQYRTRIPGVRDEWSAATPEDHLDIENLGAGRIRVEVEARVEGTPKWTAPLALDVEVPPFWYETPLARIAAIALLIAIVYLIVRLRLRALHQRAATLEATVRERTSEPRGKGRAASRFGAARARREPRQERVPGEHEPRAADAAQRRPRVRAAPLPPQGARRRRPRRALDHHEERRAPSESDQRRPVALEDRSGPRDSSTASRSTSRRCARRRERPPFPRGGRRGAAHLHDRRQAAARGHGRRRKAAPDPDQSRRQRGEVHGARFRDAGASWTNGRAVFEVEDTGPGISSDELARLFEPFVQTESGHRTKEGTGLGLRSPAISRV